MSELRSLQPVADVFFANVEDDIVVLDINSDAYFCLAGLGDHLDTRRGRLETEVQPIIDLLVASGLAEYGAPRSHPTDYVLAAPRRTSRAHQSPVGQTLEVRDFLAAAAHSAVSFPRRSVKRLIGNEDDRPPPRPPCDDELIRRAVLFDRWLPWMPFQGQCLYRAYTLRHFLRLAGLDARWVFGVRTWPFAAHCWLQSGDLVLDDDLDRVRLYTPILIA